MALAWAIREEISLYRIRASDVPDVPRAADRDPGPMSAAQLREPAPDTPTRLRTIARAIERLAVGGRTDPETIAITKQLIARDIRRIAMELQT